MPRDPGLQPERTALAWQRTGVAGAALAGTATVAAAHLAARWVLVAVAILGVLCAAAAALATTSTSRSPHRGSPWLRLLAAAAIPVLLAAAGTLLALS